MKTRWGTVVRLSADLIHDPDVLLGYPSVRRGVNTVLRLGAGAHLRSGTVVYAGSTIGRGLQTGHHVVIREENRIGDDVRVWTNSIIDYRCRIGHRVKIHSLCYIAQFSVLGDDVFLAPGVIMGNDLFPGSSESAKRLKGPTLGKGVQVGINTTILPYVRIGAGTLIGAGSVVTRDLPAGVVAWGNPARVHKKVSELSVSKRLTLLKF
jgi:acetyltransferase-like isoleucine patch superfamily enzyme